MDFKQSPFWIQIHDLPLLCMTKTVGMKIGESMGTVEDIDVTGDGVGWGRCLRMRVCVDLSELLERGRALHFGGRSYWVHFKYEKLPLFCFDYGRVIHDRGGCPVPKQARVNAAEELKEWGLWLTAELSKRNSFGGGGRRGRSYREGEGEQESGGSREEVHESYNGMSKDLRNPKPTDRSKAKGAYEDSNTYHNERDFNGESWLHKEKRDTERINNGSVFQTLHDEVGPRMMHALEAYHKKKG